MSKEYIISTPGHPSIYQYEQRELKLYFCEPDQGVNEQTGLLLLIPGFGGNSNSKVYRKMRSAFADKYNLVTVQCDYFGSEFMQGNIYPIKLTARFNEKSNVITKNDMAQINNYLKDAVITKNMYKICEKYNIDLVGYAQLSETLTNFNDMGIMQALDNISAVMIVISILKENNLNFNNNKIIIYGHSHGAYLGYLCNAMAPNLFKYLIDISAWLFPAYLNGQRFYISAINKSKLITFFDYLAGSSQIYDEELLNLTYLYKMFSNKCRIICYHGDADHLVSHKDKKVFSESVNNFIYNEISNNSIDGEIFKAANHGLDADFIKLFEYTMNEYITSKNITSTHGDSCFSDLPTITMKTQKHNYIVDYSKNIPIMNMS